MRTANQSPRPYERGFRIRGGFVSVATLERPEARTIWGKELRLRRRVRLADQAWLARQMAVLAKAGLGLPESLGLLARQRAGKVVGDLAEAMREELLAGRSPTTVVKAHEAELGALFSALVGAGEAAGVLPVTLAKLADLLEARLKLRSKTRSVVTYPLFVLTTAVVLALVILLAVVPVFSRMFAQMGAGLPGPTKVLVALSHGLLSHLWVLPLVALVIAGVVAWLRRDSRARYWASATSLRLPMVGSLVSKAALARVASTLSTMMGAGTDALSVLAYASQATANRVWSAVLDRAGDLLRSGHGLSRALRMAMAETPGTDTNFEVLAAMAEVGERSGSTPDVLGHLAQGLTEEVETGLSTLQSSVEPLLIVVVGALVGSMIIALYLPIFHVVTVLGHQTPTSGGA